MAGVTGAALALLPDREERAYFVAAAEKYHEYGMKGYADDGYCSEGVGYYNYGFRAYILLREEVCRATQGKIDFFRTPKFVRIAQYGKKIQMLNGVCPAYSDCRIGLSVDWFITNYCENVFLFEYKYYILEQDLKGFGNETHDAPIIRYAEVLLSLAEAKAELGTLTQADLDKTINVLRNRVGMPHMQLNPPMDPKYAGLGISSDLVEIRRERRVELSFENLRYQDLMRWAQGEKLKDRVLGIRFEDEDYEAERYIQRDTADPSKITGRVYKPGNSAAAAPVYTYEMDGKHYVDVYAGTSYATEKRVFDSEKDYLRPIPTAVRSKNPELGQNPKW